MYVTVDGVRNGLSPRTKEDATPLAMALLMAGFNVRINGLRVVVCYAPGYEYVQWDEGAYTGLQVGSGDTY